MKDFFWYFLSKIVFKFFFSLQIKGKKNYFKLKDKPLIIASNHTSYLDGILLLLIDRWKFYFLVDKTIAHKNPFRFFIKQIKFIPITNHSSYSIRQLIYFLRKKKTIVIFPEGRISTTGKLMNFQNGMLMISAKTKVPILPVYIKNAHLTYFSKVKEQFPKRIFQPIKLQIGDPVYVSLPKKLQSTNEYKKTNLQLMDRFQNMSFEMEDLSTSLFEMLLLGMKNSSPKKKIIQDSSLEQMSYKKLVLSALILGKLLFEKNAKSSSQFLKRSSKNVFQNREQNIGFLLPNSIAACSTFFAFQLYHKVAVMLNFTSGLSSIIHSCKLAAVQRVITSRKFVKLGNLEPTIKALSKVVEIVYLEDFREKISWKDKILALLRFTKIVSFHRSLFASSASHSGKVFSESNPAVIMFTAGSSGMPKGVVLSHRNIVANFYQFNTIVDFNLKDVLFNVLPVFHSFGLIVGLLAPLFSGLKVFLYPNPMQYRLVTKFVYFCDATIILGTNVFYRGYALKAEQTDFYKVRYAFSGAERLQDEVKQMWNEKFGIRILEGYGLTEAAPVVATNTPLHYRKNTVGRLLPALKYKLEKVAGISVAQKLYLKGPNLMLGYLKNNNSGEISFLKGWYDTGDLVNIDEDGFVQIVGRQKRFCKVAGEMISLVLVEKITKKVFPKSTVAAIATESKQKGEKIILVATDNQVNLSTIREYLLKNAENILLLPQELLKLPQIPLLGSGKINYPELVNIYCSKQ